LPGEEGDRFELFEAVKDAGDERLGRELRSFSIEGLKLRL